eukprot:Awhi_evm1s8153
MYAICRDEPSGINRSWDSDSAFPTVACLVSILSKNPSSVHDVHWLTATPSPSHSFSDINDNIRMIDLFSEAVSEEMLIYKTFLKEDKL